MWSKTPSGFRFLTIDVADHPNFPFLTITTKEVWPHLSRHTTSKKRPIDVDAASANNVVSASIRCHFEAVFLLGPYSILCSAKMIIHVLCIGVTEEIGKRKQHSRTSVARTLIARLPRLFQTRSLVLKKHPIAADIIVLGYFG